MYYVVGFFFFFVRGNGSLALFTQNNSFGLNQCCVSAVHSVFLKKNKKTKKQCHYKNLPQFLYAFTDCWTLGFFLDFVCYKYCWY